ncbi:MAG: alpha/beta hydrolase [Methanomicrobiales archaeon]|nr:alpha/beta hydrolase [Methanomicrobiales archaeon]
MYSKKLILSIPFEDRYCIIDGRKCRYWETGDSGEALVLIHGLGGTIEQWAMNIESLSKTHRVFCLDMPGCGKTAPQPDNDYTLSSLARFVDSFVREKGLGKFSIIGLSMGGAVMLQYALDFPCKINKLVSVGGAALGSRMALVFRLLTLPLIDTIPGLLTRGMFSIFVRSMVYDRSIIDNEIINFYYSGMRNRSLRQAFLKTLKANCSIFGLKKHVRLDIIDQLSRITQPVLIIWGKNDIHMPIKNALEASEVLPSSQLILFDNCKHNPQFEKPEDFSKAVLDFIG